MNGGSLNGVFTFYQCVNQIWPNGSLNIACQILVHLLCNLFFFVIFPHEKRSVLLVVSKASKVIAFNIVPFEDFLITKGLY